MDSRDAMHERLMTVRELAAFLGLHEKTIYDWTARGELPCVRLGKRLRFQASDVSRWLQARKEGV
jgi:excisionase family DNA binding protein